MMPLAYPVFLDISRLMGKMFEFEDTITTTQIRKKMFDEYGERGTVDYSTTKIISTMRELGGIESASVGKQTRVKVGVTNPEIVTFMTKVAMYLGGSSYYTFSSLTDFPFLFPFEYKLAKEVILQDEDFVTTNFGGELSVSLKS
jgi:Mor family transcriptional regulator